MFGLKERLWQERVWWKLNAASASFLIQPAMEDRVAMTGALSAYQKGKLRSPSTRYLKLSERSFSKHLGSVPLRLNLPFERTACGARSLSR